MEASTASVSSNITQSSSNSDVCPSVIVTSSGVALRKSNANQVFNIIHENNLKMEMVNYCTDIHAGLNYKQNESRYCEGNSGEIPSVELKILDQSNLQSTEGSEATGDNDYSTHFVSNAMFWNCSHCNTTKSSTEELIEDHIAICTGSAYEEGRTRILYQNHETKYSIGFDKEEACKRTTLSNEKFPSEMQEKEIPNEVVIISDNADVHKISVNSHREIVKNVVKTTSVTLGSSDIQKYWICPVCGLEKYSAISDHLKNHSKIEIVDAMSKFIPVKTKHFASKQSANANRKDSDIVEICCEIASPNKDEVSHQRNSLLKLQESNVKTAQNQSIRASTLQIAKRQGDADIDNNGSDHPEQLEDKAEAGGQSSRVRGQKGRKTGVWQSRAPHSCPVCEKVLGSKGSLSKHIIIHDIDKPWKCSICKLGFNSQRNFQYHNLQNHSEERNHVCNICFKAFALPHNLKEHMLFHGEKNKSCDICGKMFWTRKCVTRHRKRHFPGNFFVCDYCPKKFATKGEQASHNRKRHTHAP